MRKSSKRKPRPIYKPLLVVDYATHTELEIADYSCLNAFMHGVADESHFRHFNDIANMLLIAGTLKPQAALLAEFIKGDVEPILLDVKKRVERVGKLGLAGGDIAVLRELIQLHNAFWRTQQSGFLVECQTQMQAFYHEIAQQKAVA